METITNLATNATTAASKLIYGDQTKTDEAVAQTQNNETAGKEPISGETGQGTVTQPYDQGNLGTLYNSPLVMQLRLTPLRSNPSSHGRQRHLPRLLEQRDRR